MHPTNQLLALAGGNTTFPNYHTRIENTTDGGSTWIGRDVPVPDFADGVPVWQAGNINNGNTALFVSLRDLATPSTTPLILTQLTLNKSLDGGMNWSAVNNTNISVEHCTANRTPTPGVPDCDNDRPYLWTDQNPTSAYFGRTYLTETIFDNAQDYYTVGLRYTIDRGITWSPFVSLADPTEFNASRYQNSFASLAIEPNGTIVEVWHRGRCCFDENPPSINSENQVIWARSTDGGATFPISGTIAIVPRSQSITFGVSSACDPYPRCATITPAPSVTSAPNYFPGFRISDAPNVTADPIDGTLYAVWTAYRSSNGDKTTAAIYISRGIELGEKGIAWETPVVVYPDYPNKFQFFPWVQVSRDKAPGTLFHTVRLTFGAAVPSSTNNRDVAKFYVESTDGGRTFSPPYLLSGTAYQAAQSMGDYDADSVGGYNGSTGTLMTAWTDTRGGPERYGRFGTFPQVEPTTTACSIQFADVPSGSTFYPFLRCLACRGIVSGYHGSPDYKEPCLGTYGDPGQLYFRPCLAASRGEVSKIISNAAYFTDPIPGDRQTFEDVPVGSPFWMFIERLSERHIIGGYPCQTGPTFLDPCIAPANRAYFHPGSDITRGQISKVVANGAGFEETIPQGQQTFQDITTSGDAFWLYIERLAGRQIVGGYACNPGNYNTCIAAYELCVQPQQRPYFRSCNSVTRGEIAKIVANSFFPNCSTSESLSRDKPALPTPGTTNTSVSTPTFAATSYIAHRQHTRTLGYEDTPATSDPAAATILNSRCAAPTAHSAFASATYSATSTSWDFAGNGSVT